MPFPRLIKPAQVRRDELLDAAQHLFATRSYDATSISQIIATVGVSKGAFYHHFAAKEDLITALAERHAQRTTDAARVVLHDPTLDSFARLCAFLDITKAQKLSDARELQAAFAPMVRPENSHLFERINAATSAVVRPLMVRIIAEGVAEQTFDTPDPEQACDVILHLLTSQRAIAAEIFSARTRAEFDAAADRMLVRLTYLGTVIDRILGLPEGSIELADRNIIATLGEAIADDAA